MQCKKLIGEMREIERIPMSSRADLVIQCGMFDGQLRVDLRKWLGQLPLKKGVSIRVKDLPGLTATLVEIERALIKAGGLGPDDYRRKGLIAPCDFPGTD